MRHLKKGRRLSRKRDQRRALLRGLASSLILKEKIKTTEAKAKELRPFIEKMITRARKKSLANQRYLRRYFSPEITKKLISHLGPKYVGRPGGYTRIIKLSPRKTDSAKMAIIEFV